MRCSFMSIAALGFASVALAAPASFNKRDGRGKGVRTKVVTETATVTVTEIVYVPSSSAPPPPPPTTTDVVVPTPEPQPEEPTPSPEPAPEPTPAPAPAPEPEPVPEPEPTPAPQPVTEETKPTYQPTPTPEPAPEPTPTPEPEPTTAPKPSPTPAPPVGNIPDNTSPSDDLSDFERMYLDRHNELRAKTGAAPLEIDREMSTYASSHVSSCIFEHSSPRKYGENLGAGYATIADTIQAWYDEWTEYPFDKPDFYPGTGHFTQVVWKAATKVGCAMKPCNGANGTPGVYYSCNYDEGNLIGAFAENVSRPSS